MTCRIWRNWKKWKPIRDKILIRDDYQCQFCKLTLDQLKVCYGRFERLLIVHHIDGNDQNNQPENLVTLCYTCHYYSSFVDSPVHKELKSPAAMKSRANAGSCAREQSWSGKVRSPGRMPVLDEMKTYRYVWGNNEKRKTMKGRTCQVIARGSMNSCVIRFFDNGQKECVSRNSLRRCHRWQCKTKV